MGQQPTSLLALTLALALSLQATARGQATFTELPLLAGFDGSGAAAVALDGTVVGTSFRTGGPPQPTVWDPAGVPFGLGVAGIGTAITPDASVVVGTTSDVFGDAFRWTAAQGVQFLAVPGAFIVATDLSADGSVVVGWGNAGGLRWTAATGTQALGAGTRYANACSAAGDVVVGERAPFEPFRWTAAGSLDVPWTRGAATGVSADGATVLGGLASTGAFTAVRWSASSGVVPLSVPATPGSAPSSITDDGRTIVGWALGLQNTSHAFLWTEGIGLRWLDDWLRTRGAIVPAGWRLESATISGDGRFLTGTGFDLLGQRRAWRADLLGTLGDRYCTLQSPNSTHMHGVLFAAGSDVALDNDLTLHAVHLRPSAAAIFLVAPSRALVVSPGGAQGNLCLGGGIGRFLQHVVVANAFGNVRAAVDLTALPLPGGPTPVAAGETWSFQAWYRDLNPGPTSNYTDALSITFR